MTIGDHRYHRLKLRERERERLIEEQYQPTTTTTVNWLDDLETRRKNGGRD
uniref:Uncharacterized protein n=1 Tax=Cucumis melo TaxID=3656 RepID=A0A9I9DXU6_CUCME